MVGLMKSGQQQSRRIYILANIVSNYCCCTYHPPQIVVVGRLHLTLACTLYSGVWTIHSAATKGLSACFPCGNWTEYCSYLDQIYLVDTRTTAFCLACLNQR